MRNNRGKYISRGSKDISELGVAKSSTRVLPAGSIVFSSRAPIGYVAITENELYTNQGFKSVSFFTEGHQDFIYHALIGLTESIKQRASGTTFAEISGSEFGKTLIPLPPKRESSRIVKEIESYYSALEKIQDSRARYKRILSETPTSLRQQLIQAAIQGQLVPQNPNDEPASVLLERIAQERTAKLGKKAVKSMSRIERRGSKTYELFPDGSKKDISDEIPFDIPSSWEWARLSTLLECCSTGPFGSMLHKSDYVDFPKGIPLINPTNIKEGIICSLGIQKVSKEKADCLAKYRLKEGDIILARRGDLSKCAVITKAESKWLCGTGSFFLPLTMIENAYFCCVYSSQYTQSILFGDSVGSTMQNLNQSVLNNLLMPIPPLQEQHRIVEKLDALLKLV